MYLRLVALDEVDVKAPLASAARMRGLPILAVSISVAAVGHLNTSFFVFLAQIGSTLTNRWHESANQSHYQLLIGYFLHFSS